MLYLIYTHMFAHVYTHKHTDFTKDSIQNI